MVFMWTAKSKTFPYIYGIMKYVWHLSTPSDNYWTGKRVAIGSRPDIHSQLANVEKGPHSLTLESQS